jgi:hypothetical protein
MKQIFQLIAGSALLLVLVACHAPATGNTSAAMQLKVYNVPPAKTDEVNKALSSALRDKASVSTAGPGKLLVYAPRDAQASIGKAMESLDNAAEKQAAPVQVGVHFWVVDGQSGAGSDDPALKDLVGSLSSLRQTVGPLHFHLDQAAALVGTSSENGSLVTADGPYTRSFYFHIETIAGNTARLRLRYEDNGRHGLGKLDTHIDATFGQYIVLAQAPGACPQPPTNTSAATCANKPAMRLLVVQVDRLPAKA